MTCDDQIHVLVIDSTLYYAEKRFHLAWKSPHRQLWTY